MRTCVFTLAFIALAQPALAGNHHHAAHHARACHSYHPHHFTRVRMPAMEPGTITFARTDATDHPSFGDPSFPSRVRSQSTRGQIGWSEAVAPAQSFGFASAPRARTAAVRNTALDTMIARHAAANGLPVALVHRVVKRESGYNPRASHAGNFGLMQIRYATARGIGYTGSAAGLLDPEVNLTYAVKYLAGAWRAAGGNASRAVSLYASGYHGRGVQLARRRAIPADNPGWQSAPVSMRGEFMRTDASRGMI